MGDGLGSLLGDKLIRLINCCTVILFMLGLLFSILLQPKIPQLTDAFLLSRRIFIFTLCVVAPTNKFEITKIKNLSYMKVGRY